MTDHAHPERLLSEARAVVWMLVQHVGSPEACLRLGALEKREGRVVRGLLAALEALLRRILIILAFGLVSVRHARPSEPAPKPGRPSLPPPQPASGDLQARFDRQLASLSAAPFRLLTPQIHPWDGVIAFTIAPEGQARTARRWREPSPFVRTDRLARRYAAVMRVLDNPQRFARRLASKLDGVSRPHDYVELSRNAAHLDIDITPRRRSIRKSRERLFAERHPCRRAHIVASARCVQLADDWWSLKLPYLAGG